ncbi:MAG: hypothetical protein KatS3mg111_4120 [Pirellulaceae bacterium]|nr:MAG: hypothetical protein KatS3mg111_4120 [Pirellulaceae bacterium]
MPRIQELRRQYPRDGYRMITVKLRQKGWSVNFQKGRSHLPVVEFARIPMHPHARFPQTRGRADKTQRTQIVTESGGRR